MSYAPEVTLPGLPIYPEVNLQPIGDQISPIPPEFTELAQQVDGVYEESLQQGIGDIGIQHLLPRAKNTNTGGHQGGNSEFENTRQPSGGKSTNDRGSGTTSTDKSGNQK